jgi:DNA-binding transcriptional MocR family regulator
VWLEEPAYPGAVRAFAAAGARPVPVRVDQEGLDVNRGIKRCPDTRVAVTFEVVTGNAGTCLVMLLPEGFRDTVVSEKAAPSDISTVPLSICYQEEPRNQGLILGSGVNRKQIQDGMSKLATMLKA